MYLLRAVFLLLVVYLALTSNLEFSNIVVGTLLALLVVWVLGVKNRPMDVRRTPAAVWALLVFVLETAVDLVVSGVQVARLVLSPTIPNKQGIVAIPSQTETEIGRALSADAITLTPGELVVETDPSDDIMYTHSLDATAVAEVIAAQERRSRRLKNIFP